MAAAQFKYEIVEEIALLSESTKGWKKELNLISWNDREPKYDIREWSPDHTKMGKGITLTDEETMILMRSIVNRLSEEQADVILKALSSKKNGE